MAFSYEYPYTDPNRGNSDWLLNSITRILDDIKLLNEWKTQHEEEYQEIKKLYDDLLKGKFTPQMIDSFNNWLAKNAIDIIGKLATSVFFGLSDGGYFVAYIPEHWHDIVFRTTGYDIHIGDFDYGHLTLIY